MKTRKCILGGGYNAEVWLGAGGLLSLESVELERTVFYLNGSEEYKIPVRGPAIDFLKRHGQITIEGAESNVMGYHSLPESSYINFTFLFYFIKSVV